MQLRHYSIHGEQFGPVYFEELQTLLDQGRLYREDLVWRKGMDQWEPAWTVPGLSPTSARGRARDDEDADEPSRREEYRQPSRRPEVSQWPRVVSPSFALLSLIFFLLPWVDVRCNGFVLISQSGLQSCFGSYSDRGLHELGQADAQAARQQIEQTKLEPAPLIICYPILLLAV